MTERYRYGDPGFWDAPTSPAMRELGAQARSIGWGFLPMVLEDGDRTDVPVVAVVEIPANSVLPRHRRPCERLIIMVSGTLEVDGETLRTGDVERVPADTFEGPYTAGPDGVLMVEVFARHDHMDVEFEDPQAARDAMTRAAAGGG